MRSPGRDGSSFVEARIASDGNELTRLGANLGRWFYLRHALLGACALLGDLERANAGDASSHLRRFLVPVGSTARQALEHTVERGSLVFAEDYGSFWYVIVDDSRLDAQIAAGLIASGAEARDDDSFVELNGLRFEPAVERSVRVIESQLRPELLGPSRESDAAHLEIVQFAGPVKDEWLAALTASGARVVSYLPQFAYVVKVEAASQSSFAAVRAFPFVSGVTPYRPGFKLRPELRVESPVGEIEVTVQVIADSAAKRCLAEIEAEGITILGEPDPVLGYLDVELRVTRAQLFELARHPSVFAIEPIVKRRMWRDERLDQIQAGNVSSTGATASGASYLTWLKNQGFPGANANPFPFVVDVVDDGIDKGAIDTVNAEFKLSGQATASSRLAYNHNYSGDPLADGKGGHGNLNASIIGGYNSATGTKYEDTAHYNYGLGVAPWVKLGNSKVFANNGTGAFNQSTAKRMEKAYNAGARISSNSWGAIQGTNYDTDSQKHDAVVRDSVAGTAGNQEMTILFAAGNDGPNPGTVRPPATAKNVITVGASENWRPTGADGCSTPNSEADDARDMTSFSSRGPTSDGRRKPDLVAPGSHVQGAASLATGYAGDGVCDKYWPIGQTLYAWSSGTSHSTPAAAGAAALVRQAATNRAQPVPSPALVKATLMNGARYLTGTYANDTLYSNVQGMGRIDLGRTLDSVARIRVDQTQILGATGQTYTVSGTIPDAAQPFRVTLAWTDMPGPTTGAAFVNDLDLTVTVNGQLYRGNVFSGANSIPGGTPDGKNNVESVFLPTGTTGAFTITVRATLIAGDGVPGNTDTTDQDFALLVYNATQGSQHPDFVIGSGAPETTVAVGSSISVPITVTALNGFADSVGLSVNPSIPGATLSFSPPTISGGGTSQLLIATSSSTPTNSTKLTVTANSGSLTKSTSFDLVVTPVSSGNAVKSLSASPNLSIPDHLASGISSTISAAFSQTISSIAVTTDIAHSHPGDLQVLLVGPDGTTVKLHDQTGTPGAGVVTTFAIARTPVQPLTVFHGKSSLGAWKLVVADLLAQDVGTLKSWSITFNGEKSASPNLAIPDNSLTGVSSKLDFAATGKAASVRVRVKVQHAYPGDLVLSLVGPDGTTVKLLNQPSLGAPNIDTEFPDLTQTVQSLSAFQGKSIQGAWTLKVQDVVAVDVGTLVNWSLSFTAQ